jgi:hypothetical protein
LRAVAIWAGVSAAIALPLLAAAQSPLLAWRDPVYIAAGFAGIVAMALLLIQPVLIGGYLPGAPVRIGRRVHRLTGAALILAIVIHVGGLWLTSPPDVIDALTFTSPTPFAAWGVVAMWAAFGAATLAAFRKKVRPRLWRRGHTALVSVTVIGSVIHALLIEGTMETLTKLVLGILVLGVTARVVADLRVWTIRRRPG